MPAIQEQHRVRAASLAELRQKGRLTLQLDGHTVLLIAEQDRLYAIDNRCPHMGFPLDRGTVCDGILTCHWHHARFDLASGGTFDQWADDMRAFPAGVEGDDVWVDLGLRVDPQEHQRHRLRDGLERNISLVIAKSAIALLDRPEDATSITSAIEPFRMGLNFGTSYRRAGWGQGLTILTCMMALLPHLQQEDRPRALYHGLAAVANDSDGEAPRFAIRPLPGGDKDVATLKRWLRQFVEVRDEEGVERCIATAVRSGARPQELADMLLAAATDHRYIQAGHVLDFTNKALEALDVAGWGDGLDEQVLCSLATGYANAERMEESNAWRNPVDLVHILEHAFHGVSGALDAGRRWLESKAAMDGRSLLVPILLDEDPQAIADALLEALQHGVSPVELAGCVSYAAALRIAHFHTSNEFSDWDTALHTFTFANAVQMGLRRAPSVELLRGVFDAAMSLYLDRFLNVPLARLPEPGDRAGDPAGLLQELPALLDRQQQVNQAGTLVARYLNGGGDERRLLAVLGGLLLREDRDFHTIQTMEVAFRQYGLLMGSPEAVNVLVAAARYLAAQRLHRGERLFDAG
jgi:nitrite reductase/ring-hydroxylating ferredoxin subunit